VIKINILWFSEIKKDDLPRAGGKALNLGIMYQAKFPVPPGFAVSTDAYKEFLNHNQLQQPISKILSETDANSPESVTQASKQIHELILESEIPSQVKKDIEEAYEILNVSPDIVKSGGDALDIVKMGRDVPYVAIRSSATAEDLPSISKDEHILVKIDNKPIYRRMEEVYDLVQEGEGFNIEIPSLDKNQIKWSKVKSLYKHKANNDKLYKIKTATGREVTISPNHSLIVLDEETLQPKIIECITKLKGNEKLPAINQLPLIETNEKTINTLECVTGDDVIIEKEGIKIKNKSSNWSIQQPFPKELPINKDLAYFLGIYAAEGSIYNTCITITNKDKEIMDRAIKFLDSLNIYKNQKINKHSLRVYCKGLVRFLHNTCGEPSDIKGKGKLCRNKKVPEFVFGWNKELIGEFIKGCFDGDGHVSKKTVEYTSTSKMLIGGLVKLLEMLNIEFLIREKNNAFNIIIRRTNIEKFNEYIGFECKRKSKRLNKLIQDYKSQTYRPEFINNKLNISSKLSKTIKQNIDDSLNKQPVSVNFCIKCDNQLEKSSKYLEKERFYCKNCNKTFYEDKINKKIINKHIYYDKKGRFTKNQNPWNKGKLSGTYNLKEFKNKIKKYNNEEILDALHDSVKWDQIKSIEPIAYDDFVYDFTVPNIENFAAGIGGIITHNTASFAGQQETYVNIKGTKNVIETVKKCWASLFTARAIFYREKHNFKHEHVFISVVIQKMVNSEKAGVIFSANPTNNNKNEIVIEAGYGLGDAIVAGEIKPDNYIVDKENLKIIKKQVNKQKWMYELDQTTRQTVKKEINGTNQVLTDDEIINLAEYAKRLETQYQKPQDIEFGLEKGKIYILQTRAITTLHKEIKQEEVQGNVLLEGINASPGVASGTVKIIHNISEINKIEKGDILVTEMTNPSMVPTMALTSAIITNEGGISSHAAIVSRELGIPSIVGTETATEVLKDNMRVTIDGTNGKVYEGKVNIEQEQETYEDVDVKTKIYMNLGEPNEINEYKDLDIDGIGLLRLEFMIASEIQQHPLFLIKNNQQEILINKIYEGVKKVASTLHPKPIIVRFSDFKSNEYIDLEGGEEFEPEEENPMIGLRGVSRYISEEFKEAFKLEIQAIKKVREEFDNIHVMLPFVRNTSEVEKCLQIMKENGLERSENFKVWLMAEVPSIALIPEEFASLDIDGVSIGSNDLTSFVLGVDRDSTKLNKMNYFDEKNPAVLKAMKNIITEFKNKEKTVSICGQAPSNYQEIVKFLVENKVTSISVNPDAVNKVRTWVHDVEEQQNL
tara:strand:+ start:2609 stop:6463 length:3855 start_codon:yes stop_codon:yes gene_type:complete